MPVRAGVNNTMNSKLAEIKNPLKIAMDRQSWCEVIFIDEKQFTVKVTELSDDNDRDPGVWLETTDSAVMNLRLDEILNIKIS